MSQYVLVMLWMVIIYIISKTVNVYQEEYVCVWWRLWYGAVGQVHCYR